MYSINKIASLITEDPDIISELNASMNQSMNQSPDISMPPIVTDNMEPEEESGELGEVEELGVEELAGNPADQLKAQEELEQQQGLEQQAMVQPHLDQLGNTMNSLQTDVSKGIAANQIGNQSFSNLDVNMDQIQQILGQLQKQY